MYKILGADFSGFVQATNRLDYHVIVDPNTGVGELSVAPAVWPGGSDSDPTPGAVVTPISGGFEVFRDTSLNPGDVWRVLAGRSAPTRHWQQTNLWGWSTGVVIQYESGGQTPPQTISGYIEVYGIFAVYGGIQPVN